MRLGDGLARRRAIARDAIATYWPKSMCIMEGERDFSLWFAAPRDMRERALRDAAERQGASFFREASFAASGGDREFRLATSAVPHERLVEGIRRIGSAVARSSSR